MWGGSDSGAISRRCFAGFGRAAYSSIQGIVDLEGAGAMSLRIRARRWLWRKGQFLQRYVFPGGELPELADVVRAAEQVGFESRDLESLRENYVLTLRHSMKSLEDR